MIKFIDTEIDINSFIAAVKDVNNPDIKNAAANAVNNLDPHKVAEYFLNGATPKERKKVIGDVQRREYLRAMSNTIRL